MILSEGGVKKVKEKRWTKEVREVNWYTLRHDISEGNDIHCMAFTAPLMDFGSDNESDQEQYDQDLLPSVISAKKKWKKLYQIVMDKRT